MKTLFFSVFVFVLGFFLSGCGVARLYEAQALTAEQLALKSDDYVCKAANRMAVLEGYVPPIWIKELKKRDLTRIIHGAP